MSQDRRFQKNRLLLIQYYTKVPVDFDPPATADATIWGLLAAYRAPALPMAPEFCAARFWADCSRVTLFSFYSER